MYVLIEQMCERTQLQCIRSASNKQVHLEVGLGGHGKVFIPQV
jgi:hypothetical protein